MWLAWESRVSNRPAWLGHVTTRSMRSQRLRFPMLNFDQAALDWRKRTKLLFASAVHWQVLTDPGRAVGVTIMFRVPKTDDNEPSLPKQIIDLRFLLQRHDIRAQSRIHPSALFQSGGRLEDSGSTCPVNRTASVTAKTDQPAAENEWCRRR